MAHRRLVMLPAPLAYGLTQLAWWLGLQSDSEARGLDYVRYPWAVSTGKLERELGYRWRHTGREALESYLSVRAPAG